MYSDTYGGLVFSFFYGWQCIRSVDCTAGSVYVLWTVQLAVYTFCGLYSWQCIRSVDCTAGSVYVLGGGGGTVQLAVYTFCGLYSWQCMRSGGGGTVQLAVYTFWRRGDCTTGSVCVLWTVQLAVYAFCGLYSWQCMRSVDCTASSGYAFWGTVHLAGSVYVLGDCTADSVYVLGDCTAGNIYVLGTVQLAVGMRSGGLYT